MGRPGTPSEKVHVHAAVFAGILRTARLGEIVERPVAGFPVVDAAALELREYVEHRLPRRGDQQRPECQLRRRQLAALPHRPRRVDDEVAAVLAIDENEIGQDDMAAGGCEEVR